MKKTFCQQVSTFISSVFKHKKKNKEKNEKEKQKKEKVKRSSSFIKLLFKKKKKKMVSVEEMVTIARFFNTFSSVLAKQQQQQQQRKSKKKNESKHQTKTNPASSAASCKNKMIKKNETPPEEEMLLLEHVPKAELHTLARSVLGHNIHSHCCLLELDGHDDHPKPVEPDHNDHIFDEEEDHNDSHDSKPVVVDHNDHLVDGELRITTNVDNGIIDDLLHVQKLLQCILNDELMRNEKKKKVIFETLKNSEFISSEEPIIVINELLKFEQNSVANDIEFSEARLHENNHEIFYHDDDDSENGEFNDNIKKEEEIKIDELEVTKQTNANVDILVSSNFEEPKAADDDEDVLQRSTSHGYKVNGDHDQQVNFLPLIDKKKNEEKFLHMIKTTASMVVVMLSSIWLFSLFM